MIPKIGTRQVATIEPRDTYLVIPMIVNPIAMQIIAVGKCRYNITPSEVAMPLPPLNFRNTGQS